MEKVLLPIFVALSLAGLSGVPTAALVDFGGASIGALQPGHFPAGPGLSASRGILQLWQLNRITEAHLRRE